MKKTDARFELAKEIFLKKMPTEFLNEKTEGGFQATIENAIKVADKFLEEYVKETK